jgi:hypothetical protein
MMLSSSSRGQSLAMLGCVDEAVVEVGVGLFEAVRLSARGRCTPFRDCGLVVGFTACGFGFRDFVTSFSGIGTVGTSMKGC